MKIKLKYSILPFFLIFVLANSLQAQDTLKVKLGATSFVDNNFGSLKASKVLLNSLIPSSRYNIITINGPDSSAELLGLRELNKHNKPNGFVSSNPIIISSNYLLGSSDGDSHKISDLLNEDIGVLRGSVASQELSKLTQFYKTYKSISFLYTAFLNGKVDYIIVEASIAKNLIKNKIGKEKLSILNRDLFKSQIGFWIDKDNPKLLKFINSKIKNFRNSNRFENFKQEFYAIPRDYSSIIWYVSLIIIVLLAIVIFIYAYKNKAFILKYINSYKIDLNGILQIRPLPGIRFVENEDEIKQHFQDSYKQFQQKYPNIDIHVDFNNTSVKLKFNSSSNFKILDQNFLSRLSKDVEDMISVFPTDQFIIDLNLSGRYSSIRENDKFSIINKGTNVELVNANINNNTF